MSDTIRNVTEHPRWHPGFPEDNLRVLWTKKTAKSEKVAQMLREKWGFIKCPDCGVVHTALILRCRECGFGRCPRSLYAGVPTCACGDENHESPS